MISGYTESTTSRSILLAGRRITVGDILTDLVEGQTERILVENILPDRIEFAFLEPENRPITRRFSLPFNLQPTVRYLLPTQSPVNKPPVPNLHGRYPPKNEGVSDHQLPH
ncbi:MAG: hypothetical protein N2035_03460 [Chthoniobacterales bacterium]|nr:hypothetical protein [Chthoniobacterales bacterium]